MGNKKIVGICIVWLVLGISIHSVTGIEINNEKVTTFEPPIEWSKTYGSDLMDWGKCIQETSDGGYIISGTNYRNLGSLWYSYYYLIKIDASGNELWHQIYGEYNRENTAYYVQETSDGGYIIAGYEGVTSMYNAIVQKTDGEGNIVWERVFGEPNLFDEAFCVQQTLDGGYIVTGITQSYGANGNDVLLIKLNSDGTDSWIKVIGDDYNQAGTSVMQTNDGGYIITGSTDDSDYDVDILLVKTNPDGTVEWSKTFGTGNQNYEDSYSVQQTSDGGYIVLGNTPINDGYSDICLIKTDELGNKLWDKTFGGSYYDTGYSVHQTSDGGYFIVGDYTKTETMNPDVYTIKTDTNGNEQWSKIIDNNGAEDVGCYGIQTSDGDYIVCGYTGFFLNESYDVLVIKLGENHPPSAPTITGPNSGKSGDTIEYKFNAIDPNGNQVKYIIDWGDGKTNTTDLNPSGTDVTVTHVWSKKGDYTIKVHAQDQYGLDGPVSTKSVTMPRNRAITWNSLLMKVLERFPLLERILNI
jgi:hypothetical protein